MDESNAATPLFKKKVAQLKKNTARRGRPKGSKNKAKKTKKMVQKALAFTAAPKEISKDGIIAALGLLMVAVDVLKKVVEN